MKLQPTMTTNCSHHRAGTAPAPPAQPSAPWQNDWRAQHCWRDWRDPQGADSASPAPLISTAWQVADALDVNRG
eukprot:15432480-Alexandrium_andersonii.AAC.1